MGRALRNAVGGFVYHVLNRANGRMRLFGGDADYQAFEDILEQARQRVPVRLLAYAVLPNHWHLVLWPEEGRDADISRFMHWLTVTHTQRWHGYRGTAGLGHLYQGRFKSFPVQDDGHFLTVCRYVERNPLRAGLVGRAEDWRWGSLWRRTCGSAKAKALLGDWPVERSRNWLGRVNGPETLAELEVVRQCVKRGQPLGDGQWVSRTVRKLGLELTLRPRGRPKNEPGRSKHRS